MASPIVLQPIDQDWEVEVKEAAVREVVKLLPLPELLQ